MKYKQNLLILVTNPIHAFENKLNNGLSLCISTYIKNNIQVKMNHISLLFKILRLNLFFKLK